MVDAQQQSNQEAMALYYLVPMSQDCVKLFAMRNGIWFAYIYPKSEVRWELGMAI